MTTVEVLSAMKRRWYLCVAVFAAAAILTLLFARDGGLYASRTIVSFMWPTATVFSTANGTTEQSIVAFAGAVATDINDGRPPQGYGGDDAPYFGAGIREGVIVGLEDRGNQWVSDFSTAEIEIQIVGRTEGWVADRQAEMIDRVMTVADRQQDALGARPEDRVAVSVVPLTQTIEHVTPGRSSQIGAVAAMAFAALIASAWGSVSLDRVFTRRRMSQGPGFTATGRVRGGTT